MLAEGAFCVRLVVVTPSSPSGIAQVTETKFGAQSFTAVHLRRLQPVLEYGKRTKQGEGETDIIGCI